MTTSNAVQRIPWGAIAIGTAMVVSTAIAISGWERVRTRPKGRMIEVTGSAKKRIVSDQLEWTATIETQNPDRTIAVKALAGHVKAALADVDEVRETEYVGTGEHRIEKSVFKGYKASQAITVRSFDVERVERISREI